MGNLFAIMGHMNCGISLAGCKINEFIFKFNLYLPRKIRRVNYAKE